MLILSLVLFLAACRAFALGYRQIGVVLICFSVVALFTAGVKAFLVRTVAINVMDVFDDNLQDFYFLNEVVMALEEKGNGVPQMWLIESSLDYLCRKGRLEKVMSGFDEKQRPKYRKKVPMPSVRFA